MCVGTWPAGHEPLVWFSSTSASIPNQPGLSLPAAGPNTLPLSQPDIYTGRCILHLHEELERLDEAKRRMSKESHGPSGPFTPDQKKEYPSSVPALSNLHLSSLCVFDRHLYPTKHTHTAPTLPSPSIRKDVVKGLRPSGGSLALT